MATVDEEDEDHASEISHRTGTTDTPSQRAALRGEADAEAHAIFAALYARTLHELSHDLGEFEDLDLSLGSQMIQEDLDFISDSKKEHVVVTIPHPASAALPIESNVQSPEVAGRPLSSARTSSTSSSVWRSSAAAEGSRIFDEIMLEANQLTADISASESESNSSVLPASNAVEGQKVHHDIMLEAAANVSVSSSEFLAGDNDGAVEGRLLVRASAENFGTFENEGTSAAEAVDAPEHGADSQMTMSGGAEVLRIATAPSATADTSAIDEDALQRRISMYTDVDVEVITEARPGTSGSVQLRPRTGATGSESGQSRPHTGLADDRPQTSHSNISARGSGDASRPRTGLAGERPQTSNSHTSMLGGDALSRPATGDGGLLHPPTSHPSRNPSRGGEGFGLDDAQGRETQQSVDVFTLDENEVDQDEIDLTVSHDTALWSLNSLLKFLQKADPKKLEERAKKDAEDARRARLKMEARKRKSTKGVEQEQKEVYDADKPDKEVDIEIVQNILFMLDQLEATTNPSSDMYGKSQEVLIKIGNERTCRRNIAFPARGIPSLNFLVVETIKPYLKHPEKQVKLVAIECMSNVARQGDGTASAALGESAGDNDAEIKAAAVAALSKIATAEDGDDDEDKLNPLVRKMLTVTIKAASSLVAADASGTSDPFATVALQAVDADIDDIKTMRDQNFGAARELMKSNYADTLEDAPSIVDLALKRMLLKRALILEVSYVQCALIIKFL